MLVYQRVVDLNTPHLQPFCPSFRGVNPAEVSPGTPHLVLQTRHAILSSGGVPEHAHSQLEQIRCALWEAWQDPAGFKLGNGKWLEMRWLKYNYHVYKCL